MSALPSPTRANRRPNPVLRADARGAAATAPPRRAHSHPRLAGVGARIAPSVSRSLKGAILLTVAASSAFGVVKIADLVEGADSLPLRNIVVVDAAGADVSLPRASGDKRSLADEVKAYADVAIGVPFFGIDTEALKERVELHPFLREALVRRLPPDTLEIVVQERAAWAALSTPRGLYLLDEDGEVMKKVMPGDDVDMPVFTGFFDAADHDAAPRLLDDAQLALGISLLHALHQAAVVDRVSEIVALAATGFELVLVDGARVRIGDNDFTAKLQRLTATEQQLRARGRHFSFMWLDDARHPERVGVRLRSTTETSSVGG